MDPDTGPLVYSPSSEFAYTRSYIRRLVAKANDAVVTYVAGLLTFTWTTPVVVVEVVTFRDYFHPWSSNCYTLGGTIQSVYYWLGSDPTNIIPTYGNLSFGITGNPPALSLIYDPIYMNAGEFSFNLPSAPPGYWLAGA